MTDEQRFLDLLDKYLADRILPDEHQAFMQLVSTGGFDQFLKDRIGRSLLLDQTTMPLPADRAREILQGILTSTNKTENLQTPVHAEEALPQDPISISWYNTSYFRLTAVAAASVILVISTVLFWNSKKGPARLAYVQKAGQPAETIAGALVREINTSGKDKKIQLPDGTECILADSSGISYLRSFAATRDISLTGKAFFKVAHDKTKPFTVTSGRISTTALGTEFTVTALKAASLMTVRLYEGKVVVKAVDKADTRMKKDFYLLPGQEFVYSMQAPALVRNFRVRKAAGGSGWNERIDADDPAISEVNDGSWYMFNNQSLDNVLDNLAALNDTKIVYDKKSIEKIYFTGQYNKAKPLEAILERIAKLNNLKIARSDSAYVLTRR